MNFTATTDLETAGQLLRFAGESGFSAMVQEQRMLIAVNNVAFGMTGGDRPIVTATEMNDGMQIPEASQHIQDIIDDLGWQVAA